MSITYLLCDLIELVLFIQVENACCFFQRHLRVGFLHAIGDFIAKHTLLVLHLIVTRKSLPDRVEKNIHEEGEQRRWNIALGQKHLREEQVVGSLMEGVGALTLL